MEGNMDTINKKREIVLLSIGFSGAILGLCAAVYLNSLIAGALPPVPKMLCTIASYWIIGLVPVIVMLTGREKPADYGFSSDKIGQQIITGVILGIAMSLLLTLVPHLAGMSGFVDNGTRYRHLWQFIYEFVYCIFAVSLTEEFVFRGFIYKKLELLSQSSVTAAAVSSVLFGLFHFLGGSIIQIIMTGCIGAFLCFCRMKIKNCSIISLIIAHGVYDALITVWGAVFF